jgi:capsular exopolysaccharide synthesis family protein
VTEELTQKVERLPNIDVEVIADTELLQISAEDPDPGLAAFTANALAEILVNRSQELYAENISTTTVTMAEPAVVPTSPSSADPVVVIILGLALGLGGGILLAFLFENLDTRLYTSRQIETNSELQVIGDIPEARGKQQEEGMLVDHHLHAEAFRRLRTNIFSPNQNKDIKSLLLTSTVPADGKSTIVANLALSVAQGDKSVAVIDADMRRPELHSVFELSNDRGLSNFLRENASLSDVLQKTKYPGVQLISSGPRPSNPTELLDSPQMKSLIQQLSDQFDVVLLDSPASLSVTDPAVLAPQADGVLLVVRHGWVRRETLKDTLRHLNHVNARFVGIIANRTHRGLSARSIKYYPPAEMETT